MHKRVEERCGHTHATHDARISLPVQQDIGSLTKAASSALAACVSCHFWETHFMEPHIKPRKILLTSLDYARLADVLAAARQLGCTRPPLLQALENELERAEIVSPEAIPPYVVTMNTRVRLIDAETQETMNYTLVFPSAADPQHGKLSILSDLGVAILGYCVGDTIEWEFPEGIRRIRIDMIAFQPEATHQYDL
jgi:regulator of nucleoside diphosphate kinase